ncbi:TRAF-like [Arabidopsis suecica]|uniref:TRAF-like n=1 Tax=Arabidopsis suecica TaxID=45249 RepID=A0A8T2A1G7_ARASU|nr:TRAF-like [Arabidopsis suecica]
MAKGVDKKFCWEIKNFFSLNSERCNSVPVVIGDCKWRLVAFPKGYKADYFSLYLEVADFQSLPCGWRRYVKFRASIVNQLSQELSVQQETHRWFDQNARGWGFENMLPLTELNAIDGGFLVNEQVMIVAEVEFHEVIGTLDESKKIIQSNDLLNKTQEVAQQVKESIDVNGFQVLPSQVESVRRIFEKHPEIAVGFQVKNQHLRKTFMNFLVNVIETLCQSLQELSNEDLVEVDIALTYLKDAGFKVDWLEKKLDQVKEKKEKEQSGLVMLQGIEQQLHDLMHKCEKKKSEVLSIGAPLKFDDVV